MITKLETALVVLTLLATTVRCSGSPTSFESPRTVSLRVGETVELDGGRFRMKFERVESDSRCPKDAMCITAGEAVVVFGVTWRGQEGFLTFQIPPGGSATERFQDLLITIESLEPQTETGRTIQSEEYVATVRIERSPSR